MASVAWSRRARSRTSAEVLPEQARLDPLLALSGDAVGARVGAGADDLRDLGSVEVQRDATQQAVNTPAPQSEG